jgi:hypothetical protein
MPALLALRWHMVRSPLARAGFALLVTGIPVLMLTMVLLGVSLSLPAELQDGLPTVLPTLYAGFAVLALAAPVAAGGGNELFPPEQMAAFPITVPTRYHWSLLLAPLNLGWFVQLAAVLGITALALGDLTARLALGLLPVLCYVVLVSLVGQALAWMIMGLRLNRAGRVTVWVALATVLLAAAALAALAGPTRLLESLPTVRLLESVYAGYRGSLSQWALAVLVLLMGCTLAYHAGFRSCAWALSRVGDAGAQPEAQPLPRRHPARTLRAELLRVDRRSVWRSVPLRRGLVLLTVLPAVLVLVFRLDWASLVLIPSVVAAGSALLFGINVFALDGAGAIWLFSQPLDPRLVFWSKTRTLAEVCAGTVGVVLVAGATRASGVPTSTQLAAAAGAAVATSAWVIASGLRLSVTRPHLAQLRGPRDTPAPPGVMAVYSLRLAVATALIGLGYVGFSLAGSALMIGVLTAGLLLISLGRILASSRRFRDPAVHSRVARRVSSG